MENRSRNTDLNAFNRAMDTILKANPKAVKAQMAAEKQARARARTAGRKPREKGKP